MSAEDVPVRRALLFDRVLERAGDVLLPDHFGEFLGAVLARQDLIAHGVDSRIIRDAALIGSQARKHVITCKCVIKFDACGNF